MIQVNKSDGLVPTLSVLFGLDVRFRHAEKKRQQEVQRRRVLMNIKSKNSLGESDRTFAQNRHSLPPWLTINPRRSEMDSQTMRLAHQNNSYISDYNSPFKNPYQSVMSNNNQYDDSQISNPYLLKQNKSISQDISLKSSFKSKRQFNTNRNNPHNESYEPNYQNTSSISPLKGSIGLSGQLNTRNYHTFKRDISDVELIQQNDLNELSSSRLNEPSTNQIIKHKLSSQQLLNQNSPPSLFNMNEEKLKNVIKKMSSQDVEIFQDFQSNKIKLKNQLEQNQQQRQDQSQNINTEQQEGQNNQEIKQISVQKQAVEKAEENQHKITQYEADELNLKRAQFFAKTILNAKKVAEYNFNEDMQKYTMHKDERSQLVKMMQLRGKQNNIEASMREHYLQLNQIPKGKVLEKNELIVDMLRDTNQSFSKFIDDGITQETQKMADFLHEAREDEDPNFILPGNGVQLISNTRQQRVKSDMDLFHNGFKEVINKRTLPKLNLQPLSQGDTRNSQSVNHASSIKKPVLKIERVDQNTHEAQKKIIFSGDDTSIYKDQRSFNNSSTHHHRRDNSSTHRGSQYLSSQRKYDLQDYKNLVLDEISKAKLAELIKIEEHKLKIQTDLNFQNFEKVPIGTQNEIERSMRNESMKRFHYQRDRKILIKEFIRVKKQELLQEQIERKLYDQMYPVKIDYQKELINNINNICTKAGQRRFGNLNYTLLKSEHGDNESDQPQYNIDHVISHVKESTQKSKRRINQINEEMLNLYGHRSIKRV
eukprot:403342613